MDLVELIKTVQEVDQLVDDLETDVSFVCMYIMGYRIILNTKLCFFNEKKNQIYFLVSFCKSLSFLVSFPEYHPHQKVYYNLFILIIFSIFIYIFQKT